ncbi:hypothetical protein J6590_048708 [Homalodisca vitripennis]|nr:hypothetical protein J6590_048708 [Homalodisca vitripennis]
MASKTQQLIWKGRRTSDYYGLPEIAQDNEAKYLGIIKDDKLSWNPHIDDLCKLTPHESCRQTFEELGILTVVSLYICEATYYTIAQKPDHLGNNHNYNTRNAYDYALPTHHLTLFENKPTYMGRKLFNQLPEDLNRRREDKNFKTSLKTWLLQKSFYTLE